jgi:hypothetical protein
MKEAFIIAACKPVTAILAILIFGAAILREAIDGVTK